MPDDDMPLDVETDSPTDALDPPAIEDDSGVGDAVAIPQTNPVTLCDC